MSKVSCLYAKSGGAAFIAAVLVLVAFQGTGLSQNDRGVGLNHRNAQDEPSLQYDRGQSVVPLYSGWSKNPDGTLDLHFGYLNRNWEERVHIPIGPDNNFSPAPFGPDAGQPTYFLPRQNRWQFKVRVPADWIKGDKELVWTLTAHGETLRAYGVIKSGFYEDAFGMQREFYGGPGKEGNQWPVVKVEAEQLTTKVGQPVTLAAVATDDGLPKPGLAPGVTSVSRVPVTAAEGGAVGNAGGRAGPRGLRFAWYVYRAPAELPSGATSLKLVTFDPRQFDVWEDPRAGADSPLSPGWKTPPVPPGNRWVAQATFSAPGTYVIKGLAHDGIAWGSEGITVIVAP